MEQLPLTLDFQNLTKLPALSATQIQRISLKYKEWTESNFAGFRRILDETSDEAPNFKVISQVVQLFQTGSTGKKIKNFVVLGTGGSSLGGETILRALRPTLATPQFYFLDNNDPSFFSDHLQFWNAEETLFYAVSKSGKTPETISQMLVAIEWLQSTLTDKDGWKKHFILCTDPETGDFRELSKQFSLTCLSVPPAVGGRFSVLTPVALFPAAYAGLSIENFLLGAKSLVDAWEKPPLQQNPCFQLAHALVNDKTRPITVSMPYSSQLQAFSRWFCQLWAESLGKENKGLTPYPAIGTTDQHSQMQLYMQGSKDKCIGFINIKNHKNPLPISLPPGMDALPAFKLLENKSMLDLFQAEFHATKDALTEQKVPNFTVTIDFLNERSLGALFYFWEWTTVYAGALLEINPFDQPGVEAAKLLTKKYLAEGK